MYELKPCIYRHEHLCVYVHTFGLAGATARLHVVGSFTRDVSTKRLGTGDRGV